jgi:hypothetical protein
VFEGLEATQQEWMTEYLDLACPCQLTAADLERLRSKLLTTQVFQSVDLKVETLEQSEHQRLRIHVLEKWTVIPVIRGAVGGGTPLLVVGIYDSHAWGRLWTIGGETRTYGQAPTGGVVWARAPRWRQGFHYLNFELWRDNRIRSFYDERDREIGSVYGSATSLVAEGLAPILSSGWQWGLRANYRQQNILRWYEEAAFGPEGIKLDPVDLQRWQLRLVYDDLEVDQLAIKGSRFLLTGGPVISEGRTSYGFEQEFFAYGRWDPDWNLVWHQWLGYAQERSYQNLFFLGGFDSVRGLPDGSLYGNKAYYVNVEARRMFHRARYAWFQAAAYLDYGSAGFSFKDLKERDRATLGAGLRIAIPQVHRLMLRVDYAWSLDRPETSSISAGMNQFIDPYRPL